MVSRSLALASLLLTATAAQSELSCSEPAWHTAFVLEPEAGCPGEWQQALPGPESTIPVGHAFAGPPEAVCTRGSTGLAQLSAVVAEGWTYNQVRGSLQSILA